MTEKRFIELGSTHIQDTLTGDEFYAPCEHRLCDLLNELYEENISLKQEKKFLQNKIKTYKTGNTILKKTLDKEWK